MARVRLAPCTSPASRGVFQPNHVFYGHGWCIHSLILLALPLIRWALGLLRLRVRRNPPAISQLWFQPPTSGRKPRGTSKLQGRI